MVIIFKLIFLFFETPFLLFSFPLYHLLKNYMFSVSMRQFIPLFSHLVCLSLFQLRVLFFLDVMIFLINNLMYPISFQHILQYLRKYLLFLCRLHPCNIILLFLNILVLHSLTKTHALLFYWFLILTYLNRQIYSWVVLLFSFLLPKNYLKKYLLYNSSVWTLNNSFLLWLL